jgi:hypothetical protein
MGEEEEKKGFTVRDRRVGARAEEPAKGEGEKKERKPELPKEESPPVDASLPEIDFSSFIFSLSTSALLHLGEVPDPITQKREKNLPLAKQTIDILGILQQKTRGNLNPEEDKMMEHILADLRWRYIREAKG